MKTRYIRRRKNTMEKLEDKDKVHMKRKEHHCELNHIAKATQPNLR